MSYQYTFQCGSCLKNTSFKGKSYEEAVKNAMREGWSRHDAFGLVCKKCGEELKLITISPVQE